MSRFWLKRPDAINGLRTNRQLKFPVFRQFLNSGLVFSVIVNKSIQKMLAYGSSAILIFGKIQYMFLETSANIEAYVIRLPIKILEAVNEFSAAWFKNITSFVSVENEFNLSFNKAVSITLNFLSFFNVVLRKTITKTLDALTDLISHITKNNLIGIAVTSIFDVFILASQSIFKIFYKALNVALGFGASLSKTPDKLLAVGNSLSAGIERQTIKIVSVGAIFTVRLLKNMEMFLPSSTELALTLGKAIGKLLQMVLLIGLSLSRNVLKIFEFSASFVLSLSKMVNKFLTTAANLLSKLTKNVPKRLSVGLTTTLKIVRRSFKILQINIALAIFLTRQFIALVRGLAKATVSRIVNIVSNIGKVAEARGRVDKES